MTLDARPGRRWQVSSPPALFAFWDEEGGWVGGASGCGDSDCACTGVTLQLLRVSRAVQRVELAQGKLAIVAPPGRGCVDDAEVQLRVTPEVGIVEPDDGEDERAIALAATLDGTLDGRLLDALHAVWLGVKGYQVDEVLERPCLDDWEPGYRVQYEALIGGTRGDLFEADGVVWIAVDFHCVTPSCPCRDVDLVFVPEGPVQEADPPLLQVHVTLPAGRASRWLPAQLECDPADAAHRQLLERLWAAYRQRHPDPDRLRQRRARMKVVARETMSEHFPAPARSTHIGRNAPCPCGSDKKYKRCCGR